MPAGALISPMLAKAGALPGADEEHAWAFEMKWDGIRAIVLVDRRSHPRSAPETTATSQWPTPS